MTVLGLSSADLDRLVVDGWYTKDAAEKPTVEVNGGLPAGTAPSRAVSREPWGRSPEWHTFGGQGLKDYVSRMHVANRLLEALPGMWLAVDPQDLWRLNRRRLSAALTTIRRSS